MTDSLAPTPGGRRALPGAGVLLDVDGTLVDTNYLHTLAWSRALRDVGEWAPMHAVHRVVGMGGDQLVPELVGSMVDGADEAWRRRYEELAAEARPFPGAAGLVVRLRDLGLRVVLATSSPAELVDRTVELLGVGDALTAVTTADDVSSSKPDPEVFTAAMDAGGIDPALALAVGDSVWDVRAARAAGIGCIGLESGGFSRHELAEDGAVAVYRDVGELVEQFMTGPLAALLG